MDDSIDVIISDYLHAMDDIITCRWFRDEDPVYIDFPTQEEEQEIPNM